jgi:hypothetical protein
MFGFVIKLKLSSLDELRYVKLDMQLNSNTKVEALFGQPVFWQTSCYVFALLVYRCFNCVSAFLEASASNTVLRSVWYCVKL